MRKKGPLRADSRTFTLYAQDLQSLGGRHSLCVSHALFLPYYYLPGHINILIRSVAVMIVSRNPYLQSLRPEAEVPC